MSEVHNTTKPTSIFITDIAEKFSEINAHLLWEVMLRTYSRYKYYHVDHPFLMGLKLSVNIKAISMVVHGNK